MTLPIVRPSHPHFGSFARQFSDALDSGVLTNNGPYVQEFERRLTEILDVPTICFSSGMAAMIAMLRACDVEGMEVIVPSFGFCATPHAVVMAGAKPVFADIDPKTLCLDPEDVERRITSRTTAVLGSDPYGICWEPPDSWMTGELDILIDAAPSFGSLNRDRHPVTRGHAQIYSFHATKPFSTMEGGILCSRNLDLLNKAKRIRNFGQGPDGDCDIVGFNGKMMEICAIIGLRQLDEFDARLRSRVESASRLRRALDGIRGLRVQRAPLGQSPCWTYQPVFVEPEFGKSRDEVVAGLTERGIGVRRYYTACHLMSVYWPEQHYPNFHADTDSKYKADLPVTERLASQVISLPVYDDMQDAEIEQIAAVFKAIRGG